MTSTSFRLTASTSTSSAASVACFMALRRAVNSEASDSSTAEYSLTSTYLGSSCRSSSSGEGSIRASAAPAAAKKPIGPKSTAVTDDIIDAIAEEMDRAMQRLELPGAPRPFSISYKITEVEVNDAVASLGRSKPDAIVSDIDVPGLTGIELLKAVRREARGRLLEPDLALAHEACDVDRARDVQRDAARQRDDLVREVDGTVRRLQPHRAHDLPHAQQRDDQDIGLEHGLVDEAPLVLVGVLQAAGGAALHRGAA